MNQTTQWLTTWQDVRALTTQFQPRAARRLESIFVVRRAPVNPAEVLCSVDGLGFSALNPEQQVIALAALQVITVPPNTVICVKGEPAQGVMFILSRGPAVLQERTGEWFTRCAVLDLEGLLFGESLCAETVTSGLQPVEMAVLPPQQFSSWVELRVRLLQHKFPVLRALPAVEVEALQFKHTWFAPGTALDANNKLVLVTHGVVQEGGARLFPGHVLGAECIVSGVESTAAAESPVGCAALSTQQSAELLQTNMDFLTAIMDIAIRQSADAEQRQASTHKDTLPSHEPLNATAAPRRALVQTSTLVKSGEHQYNQYTLKAALGKGATAVVYSATSAPEGALWAVKVVNRTSTVDLNLVREIQALSQLVHPNIIGLWEVIDQPSEPIVLLVQEHAAWGSLLGVVLNHSEARRCAKGCLLGLQYMHSQGFTHGDIKPANLLRDCAGNLKIADFGCATRLADKENSTWTRPPGTPAFMAPEAFGGAVGTVEADAWAFVATVFCLVYGCPPFTALRREGLTDAILYESLQFGKESTEQQALQSTSEEDVNLRNFCEHGLQKSVQKRLTLNQMGAHSWMMMRGRKRVVN